MSVCHKCKQPIEFRYIKGVCIPIHTSGGCISSRPRVNDYSGYKSSDKSECFPTNCPKCESQVFFVRHNGGSVWFDSPLGWPWYKHECFVVDSQLLSKANSLILTSTNEKEREIRPGCQIGVVKMTHVEPNRNYTDVFFDTGDAHEAKYRLAYNAGILLGELCLLDEKQKLIWIYDDPQYSFEFYDLRPREYSIPADIQARKASQQRRKIKTEALKKAKEKRKDEMAFELIQKLSKTFAIDKHVGHELIQKYGIDRLRRVAPVEYAETIEAAFKFSKENLENRNAENEEQVAAIAKIRKAIRDIKKKRS